MRYSPRRKTYGGGANIFAANARLSRCVLFLEWLVYSQLGYRVIRRCA
jgi:hypothetical protein